MHLNDDDDHDQPIVPLSSQIPCFLPLEIRRSYLSSVLLFLVLRCYSHLIRVSVLVCESGPMLDMHKYSQHTGFNNAMKPLISHYSGVAVQKFSHYRESANSETLSIIILC